MGDGDPPLGVEQYIAMQRLAVPGSEKNASSGLWASGVLAARVVYHGNGNEGGIG